MLVEFVVLSSILLTLFYLYLRQYYDYWKNRGVKTLPTHFIFGNNFEATIFKKNRNEVQTELYQAGAGHPYLGLIGTRKPYLFVRDPEIIRHILTKDFSYFHDRIFPVDEKRDPLSAHLFNLEGARWRNLRTKLTPTFTSGKMKNMLPLMQQCAEELLTVLESSASSEKVIEMREILARFTTDVIGTCAFGVECHSLRDPNAKFRKMGAAFFQPSVYTSVKQILMFMCPPLAKVIPLSSNIKEMNDFFLGAIRDTVRYREENNVQRKDFLDLLMEIKKKGTIVGNTEELKNDAFVKNMGDMKMEEFEFTETLMASQAFVFFLAGFETSATTMSFALTELSRNQDVQEKLRKEIDEAYERHGNEFTYEALMMEMPYLDKVVSETLRMHPPVPSLIRKTTGRYKMPDSDLVLDKDLIVIIPVYVLHHDPNIYPDPEIFDPERFSEEQRETRHNYAYLPFGEGPRNCIGQRFGLLQVKLGLSMLLHKFKFEFGPNMQYPPVLSKFTFLTSQVHGTDLRISKRTPRAEKIN